MSIEAICTWCFKKLNGRVCICVIHTHADIMVDGILAPKENRPQSLEPVNVSFNADSIDVTE